MTPNPSVELASSSELRLLPAAAHIQRERSVGLHFYLALAASLAVSACSPPSGVPPAPELFISPDAFVVDGTAFGSASEGAARVTAGNPSQVSIVACPAMGTQRVQDAMQGVQLRFKGRIVLSVIGPGERGCPIASKG